MDNRQNYEWNSSLIPLLAFGGISFSIALWEDFYHAFVYYTAKSLCILCSRISIIHLFVAVSSPILLLSPTQDLAELAFVYLKLRACMPSPTQ
jgi:hypothetical protein